MSKYDLRVARKTNPYAVADEPTPVAPGRATVTSRMSPSPSSRSIARAVIAEMNGVAPGADALVAAAGASSGHALPTGLRSQFEASLGADLGGVRVHTDDAAAAASDALGARAYATGQDVYMGAGEYRPDSSDGVWLIAHEVAHTVQQRGATAAPACKLEVSAPGDAMEIEADAAADAMVSGRTASVGAAPIALHRQQYAGMDAGVAQQQAAPPRPIPASESTSPNITPSNWLEDGRRRAATIAPNSNALRSEGELSFPAAPPEVVGDSGLAAAWQEMGGVVIEVSQTWQDALPELTRYLALPISPAIAGGAGQRVDDVVTPAGDARPVDPATRDALFGSSEFQGSAAHVQAAAARVDAELAHVRAATSNILEADHAIVAALSRGAAGAARNRATAAQSERATLEQGRATAVATVQNLVRVVEIGAMLVAGGSTGAAAAPATAPAAVTRTAATAPIGMGVNASHDLVLSIAEHFINEAWADQIEHANHDIEVALHDEHLALEEAQRAEIAQATARGTTARAMLQQANQELRAAHLEYRAAIQQSATAAAHAAPGPGGANAQATIAAQVAVQARIGTLRELQARLRVPPYDEASGSAFAVWEAHEGIESPARFRNTLARLLLFTERFVPGELAQWEHRLQSLSSTVSALSPAPR